MAFVAAEVRNPRKNILRALLLGTAAVTLIYVLINLAFFHALGLAGMRLPGVAANVLQIGLGSVGPAADQPADLHFRVGGDQRHDPDRGADLLCPGDRASAVCLAGPLEPAMETPPGRWPFRRP